jgi:flagellar motor switch protein FliN/FliY
VTETVEYEQFDQDAQEPTAAAAEADLNRLRDIPMELAVEIGRTEMTVGDTLGLHVGSVVELARQAGDPVDLLVNGTAIARGEVVVIDECYGLRIVEILDGRQQPSLLQGSEPGDPAAGEQTVSADGAPAG